MKQIVVFLSLVIGSFICYVGCDKPPVVSPVALPVTSPVTPPVTPPVVTPPVFKSRYQTIVEAAENGTVEDVEYFIKQGSDVNAKNESGITPLWGAVRQNNLEIVKLLVENGADFITKDEAGMTPLSIAMFRNSFEIVRFFIEKGAGKDELEEIEEELATRERRAAELERELERRERDNQRAMEAARERERAAQEVAREQERAAQERKQERERVDAIMRQRQRLTAEQRAANPIVCPKCDGVGTTKCSHDSFIRDCIFCKGTYKEQCRTCNGRGIVY